MLASGKASALVADHHRLVQVREYRVAHGAIMTEAFHLEEPSIGLEADAAVGRELVRGQSPVGGSWSRTTAR